VVAEAPKSGLPSQTRFKVVGGPITPHA